jgi:hypothetical protein
VLLQTSEPEPCFLSTPPPPPPLSPPPTRYTLAHSGAFECRGLVGTSSGSRLLYRCINGKWTLFQVSLAAAAQPTLCIASSRPHPFALADMTPFVRIAAPFGHVTCGATSWRTTTAAATAARAWCAAAPHRATCHPRPAPSQTACAITPTPSTNPVKRRPLSSQTPHLSTTATSDACVQPCCQLCPQPLRLRQLRPRPSPSRRVCATTRLLDSSARQRLDSSAPRIRIAVWRAVRRHFALRAITTPRNSRSFQTGRLAPVNPARPACTLRFRRLHGRATAICIHSSIH